MTLALQRPRPDVRPSANGAFAINGRFYTQAVTGVQRYAREVTLAIDELLAASDATALCLTPGSACDIPNLKAIRVERLGRLEGQLWEQLLLPLQCRQPLLNLCNVAPATVGRQVVCVHDANVYCEPQSYSRPFRWYYQALQPHLARRAMRLTTVSKASAGQLAQVLPVGLDDIVVLPNGHEHVRRWSASRSTLFADRPAGRPFVLLLGSRARHKNAALILGLADALDALGLDLYVAGGRAGIFAATAVQDHANVRWLGIVSDDDLAALFSSALCLAFPSLSEGFGLPIVEAMALGCPVVSSDRASLPEVCGTAALLAPPDRPLDWMSHFRDLAASSDLRDDLRGRGRVRARAYSWTETARGYLNLFGL